MHAISILIYILPTESFPVNVVQEYKEKRNKQTNSASAKQVCFLIEKQKPKKKRSNDLINAKKQASGKAGSELKHMISAVDFRV